MSDDHIRAYLRSRAAGLAPPDLADAISRDADAMPQQRRSWFATFVPAAAALGLTAVVIVAAILVGQDPDVGPLPSESPAPISTPHPSVESQPSPTPTSSAPTDSGSLTDAGGVLTMPAQDEEGHWGTVTMERLPDLGGLREIVEVDIDEANPHPASLYFVNDPAMLYLEVAVEYLAEREPDPLDFGSDDWTVLGGPEPIAPSQVGLDALRSHLPGAMAVVGEPVGGILQFAVPRELAGIELQLAYRPVGFDDPVWVAPLGRLPADPPEPFVMTPPSGAGTLEQAAAQRDVMTATAAAQAEVLFATPDTCTNPVAGYTVTFPDAWYTNTAIGPWPACSWFSPTFFEVEDPEVVPDEVAIVITYQPDSGPFGAPSVAVAGDAVEVDGRPAAWAEYVGVGGGFIDIGSFLYQYMVALDGQAPEEGETGDTLIAGASWALEEDPAAYRLATAVLDRIMASLTFDD